MSSNKAGRFARQRVTRAYRSLAMAMLWTIVVSTACVVWTGRHWHLGWMGIAGIGSILGLVISGGLLLLVYRSDVTWVGNWRKGAIGEEQVGAVLDQMEHEGYRALHDVEARRGNIDHVLAGPTGVFALETKAWRGRVWLSKGGRLRVGGRSEDRAVEQAKKGARYVRDAMKGAGIHGWVEAVIVLTATSMPLGPMKLGAVTVVTLDELPAFVRSRHREMDNLEAARIIAAVYRASRGRSDVITVVR